MGVFRERFRRLEDPILDQVRFDVGGHLGDTNGSLLESLSKR